MAQFAFAAIQQALEDAQLVLEQEDLQRIGAVIANTQSRRTTITTIARISSTNVGPRLKIRLRIKKSVERAPRSMTRLSVPVCLVWWKSSDSDSAWPIANALSTASWAWRMA